MTNFLNSLKLNNYLSFGLGFTTLWCLITGEQYNTLVCVHGQLCHAIALFLQVL